MTYAPRLAAILAILVGLAATTVSAQTPAATVKDGSGNVVLQSYTGGGLLAPDQGASLGDIPAENAGTRLMWYPGKAALRAGEVDGSQWNDGNIGDGSVAFGSDTEASGTWSVAMGHQSTASASNAVAMGDNATAKSEGAVAMGRGTTAGSSFVTADNAVAMGTGTTASDISTTAMGDGTTASDIAATAMGIETTASGFATMATGQNAKAASDNTFVWADGSDSSSDKFSSADDPNGSGVTGSQTFHVKATSGVRFITSGGTTYIPGNSTGWSTMSTRSAKTDVTPVDPTTVLKAVRDMPISTWEYKSDDGEGQGPRHIGPMAEDFHGTLPYDLGGSDDHINSINADGVALGAVKGLARTVERQQATIDSLERRVEQVDAVKAENEQIKKRLATLEAARGPATAGWTGDALGLVLAALLGGLLGAGLLAVRS